MKQLAFYDFLRHLKRNIFLALLLAVICLLTTSLYSLFKYEYGRYKPFAEIDIDKGVFVGHKHATSYGDGDFDSMIEHLEGIECLYQGYRGAVTLDGKHCTVYVFEDWVWENWQGRMKSGTWFDEPEVQSDAVQVIASGNFPDAKVGDLFICKTKTTTSKCVIRGILQDDTEIPLSENQNVNNMTYDGLYDVPDPEMGRFVLMQKETAEMIGVDMHSAGAWGFIKFKDNISDEEIKTLTRTISIATLSTGCSYSNFISLSLDKLTSKLFAYLPMIGAGIILAMISLLTVAFINIEKGSKYYSIYYLVGGSKKKCFNIAMGNVLGIIAVSGIMYICGGHLVTAYTRAANIVYSPTAGAGVFAIILYGVFALFMLLCMYIAMRKNSPLEMLRKRK